MKSKSIPFHICLLFLLLLNCSVAGANTKYYFKHININNGLSQNTVRAIFQDRLGFMWFGTKDGLNRFDGNSFKVFKFSPVGSLNDNVFHRIVQDENDYIWVSTENGVYIYDPYHEKFDLFDQVTSDKDSVKGVVTEMIKDGDGDIWMSVENKGIFHYRFADEQLDFYEIPLVKDGMKMVSLCADQNGVWVFPYSSPFLYINKETKEVSTFNLEDDKELMSHVGEVSDVFLDTHNQLLVATSQKGLIAINTVNKTHRVLLDFDDKGEPIFVRCIERIDSETLSIGTESGIYIYRSDTGEIVNIRQDNSVPYSLSDNAVYAIYKDRDGGIWVGTYFGGVNYYNNQYNLFKSYIPTHGEGMLNGNRIREFCRGPGGEIWIGTEDGGLNLFDPETDTFLNLPQPLQSLYSNIHALYIDGDFLWIGAYSKGLNRYNLKTGELKTFTHDDSPGSISQNSVFSLIKDSQGVLWVGTLAGVDIYDERREQFIRVDKLKGMSIQDIFEDSNGFIWISTFLDGLYRFNPVDREWRVFLHDINDPNSLPYNKTTSVYEDHKRRLWVTTQGGGFGLYDRENETFTTYNSANGLPNDVVYQIIDDQTGSLWLSTNSGLVLFNPDKKCFKNFTVENGLKTNQFNYQSSYKSRDGMIYFGSLEGFIRFDPTDISEAKSTAPVVITDFYVNNIRISPNDENATLKESIIYTDIVELPYNQNSISLSYAYLDYSNSDTQQVQYFLDGFSKRWISADDNQSILFSNLKPGRYELLLGVESMKSDDAVEIVEALTIHIRPPFWLNGWAYLFYLILLVVVVYLLLRYVNQRNRISEQNKIRDFQQIKEREIYQSKINFFTNVAHEIRTPLTLIKAPLDHLLMTNDVSEHAKENLQIMSNNTVRLLDLANQLLDFRKTESEAYLLNLQTHNVTQLIQDTILRFKPFANQKEITIDVDIPANDMMVQLDKEAFLKIFSNLLNNALKYCDDYVRVEAFIQNDELQTFHLITQNNGELIPVGYEKEIFKPFVQIETDDKQHGTGTGIGLALASSLTELHNGKLFLENDNNYNRFHLILPMREELIHSTAKQNESQNNTQIEESRNEQANRVTLLLVDDDPELLDFESKMLSSCYNVIVAKNGVEAIKVLRDRTIGLIISDVVMPEMDGFALIEKVKTNIEYSHIPVLLLTAKVMVQSKVQGYELGADAYLEKPFSVEVLLALIANLLQNREILRESFMKNPFIGVSTVALTKSDETFMVKLNKLMQDNLSDSEFNVEDMADHFNMSRASFYRKVKGVLDLTPNEYLRIERLKKAAHFLKENDFKVNEICYMVGFNSPSYFSKCFYQQFGVLPKDFPEQS